MTGQPSPGVTKVATQSFLNKSRRPRSKKKVTQKKTTSKDGNTMVTTIETTVTTSGVSFMEDLDLDCKMAEFCPPELNLSSDDSETKTLDSDAGKKQTIQKKQVSEFKDIDLMQSTKDLLARQKKKGKMKRSKTETSHRRTKSARQPSNSKKAKKYFHLSSPEKPKKKKRSRSVDITDEKRTEKKGKNKLDVREKERSRSFDSRGDRDFKKKKLRAQTESNLVRSKKGHSRSKSAAVTPSPTKKKKRKFQLGHTEKPPTSKPKKPSKKRTPKSSSILTSPKRPSPKKAFKMPDPPVRPKNPGLFNNDLYFLDECQRIPPLFDPLHGSIMDDHVGFKRQMTMFYINHLSSFLTQLSLREGQVRDKIKNHDEEMGRYSGTLVELEEEYSSKKHLVEEYERAIEEFEYCKETLSALNERAYAFLKSMRRPPPVFHHIIAGVLLVLGYDNSDWDECKRFLLDSDCRKEILNFDPTTIDLDNILPFADWMQKHTESFKIKRAERVSPIAALLLRWLLSLVNVCEQVKRFHKLRGEKHGTLQEIETLKQRIVKITHMLNDGDQTLKYWKLLLKQILANKEEIQKVLKQCESMKNQNPMTSHGSCQTPI